MPPQPHRRPAPFGKREDGRGKRAFLSDGSRAVLMGLSQRIMRIKNPSRPPPPLCPSYHLHPPPYLRSLNPRPLPHLRRLYLRYPPPYLPTQSAFHLRNPCNPRFRRVTRALRPTCVPSIRVLCPTYGVCIYDILRPTRQPNPPFICVIRVIRDSDELPARFAPPAFPRACPNAGQPQGVVPTMPLGAHT